MPVHIDRKLESRDSLVRKISALERENATLRAEVSRVSEQAQAARRAATESWQWARQMLPGPRPAIPEPHDIRPAGPLPPARPRWSRPRP